MRNSTPCLGNTGRGLLPDSRSAPPGGGGTITKAPAPRDAAVMSMQNDTRRKYFMVRTISHVDRTATQLKTRFLCALFLTSCKTTPVLRGLISPLPLRTQVFSPHVHRRRPHCPA